LTEQKQQEL